MFLHHLVFVALAVSASCFHIPKGQPEGVYSVLTHKNGTEIHTLMTTSSGAQLRADYARVYSFLPSAKFKPRQLPNPPYWNKISCGGYYLDVDDTNAANNDLDAQCGTGAYVGADLDYYSIRGCTVSYFCNKSYVQYDFYWARRAISWACFASYRQKIANAINSRCGGFGAGWDYVGNADGSESGVYGWENYCYQGHNFCGRGV